jgi:hypothetical protein
VSLRSSRSSLDQAAAFEQRSALRAASAGTPAQPAIARTPHILDMAGGLDDMGKQGGGLRDAGVSLVQIVQTGRGAEPTAAPACRPPIRTNVSIDAGRRARARFRRSLPMWRRSSSLARVRAEARGFTDQQSCAGLRGALRLLDCTRKSHAPDTAERDRCCPLPERDRDAVKRRLRQAWLDTDRDIELEQLGALAR